MSPIPELDVDSTPARYLSNLVNGFWATQVINTAVILGVPDQLASGPRTAESLAASMAALWKQFGDLAQCVKTGETVWAHASREEGFKQPSDYLERAGVSERGSFVGGNFFEAVPRRVLGRAGHAGGDGRRRRPRASEGCLPRPEGRGLPRVLVTGPTRPLRKPARRCVLASEPRRAF